MKWAARALIVSLLLIAGGFALYAYAGYFGGPVFVERQAGANRKAGTAAVVLSGDMGFDIGMAHLIANRLNRDGVPVVGVNSLTYFARRRRPEDVRSLIERAIDRAMAIGHTNRVVLIGQSFGADMLHVGLAGLPQAYRDHVAAVVLVVPGDTVMMRAWPGELLEIVPPDAAALPTARMLDWTPVTCIWGERETDSLCPRLRLRNAKVIALPGGHPLGWNIDRLYAAIRQSAGAALKITD